MDRDIKKGGGVGKRDREERETLRRGEQGVRSVGRRCKKPAKNINVRLASSRLGSPSVAVARNRAARSRGGVSIDVTPIRGRF